MKLRKWLIDYIPMGLTAILIIYFAITREQSFIKTLPTLNTLVILLLTVSANRYAFLYGGINCIIYSISYISERLWFTTISTLLFSLPIQIFSFIHWGKHKSGKASAELRVLSGKGRLLTVIASLAGWAFCYFALLPLFKDAAFPSLDTLSFITSIIATVLSSIRFVDAQYINLINGGAQLVIWIMLTVENPGNFNYVIISCYNLFRIAEASVMWTRQYIQSKKEKECIAT